MPRHTQGLAGRFKKTTKPWNSAIFQLMGRAVKPYDAGNS